MLSNELTFWRNTGWGGALSLSYVNLQTHQTCGELLSLRGVLAWGPCVALCAAGRLPGRRLTGGAGGACCGQPAGSVCEGLGVLSPRWQVQACPARVVPPPPAPLPLPLPDAPGLGFTQQGTGPCCRPPAVQVVRRARDSEGQRAS